MMSRPLGVGAPPLPVLGELPAGGSQGYTRLLLRSTAQLIHTRSTVIFSHFSLTIGFIPRYSAHAYRPGVDQGRWRTAMLASVGLGRLVALVW